jgi:Flp pilus assembly protein TadG
MMRTAQDQGRRGAAAVELAIWLPFLSLMFVVAVDFCRVFHHTQTLQNCADTAARYASGTADASSSANREQEARKAAVADGVSLNPPLQDQNVRFDYEGNFAAATVEYEFTWLVPWPGNGDKVNLSRTCRMPLAPKLPGE